MRIDSALYADKVLGGWLGKNIGGTLGMPLEGEMDVNTLVYYDPYPKGATPNDDLDLQVLWMYAMQEHGRGVTSHDFRKAWITHITNPFPDEYGKCDINMNRGLLPPVCGWYNNYFTNCMGAPIRSEIWAMICPGHPEIAVQYAYNDAVLDHTGEGVNGEVFLAALESAAFLNSDLASLIDIGLSYIPSDSDIAKSIKFVVDARKKGLDWLSARNGVVDMFHSVNFTNAPTNLGFMAIGLLYGKTFDECLTMAVNCGWDTDCTGATVGAILGIIHGTKAIPEKWIKPIGHELVHDPNMFPSQPFKDLEELTAATVKLGLELLDEPSSKDRPIDPSEFAEGLRHTHLSHFRMHIPGGEICLDYNGFPTLSQFDEKCITYTYTAAAGNTDEYDLVPRENDNLSIAVTRMPNSDAGTLSCAVKVRASGGHWPPYQVFGLQLMRKQEVVHDLPVTLISKKLWEVSGSVEVTDSNTYDAIDPFSIPDASFSAIESDDESIGCLFGDANNCMMVARRKVYFPESIETRLMSECGDWISVWHEGTQIIDSRRRDGVVPSPHRSRATGKCITVNKGWNTFTVKALKRDLDYEGFFFFADPKTLMSYIDID